MSDVSASQGSASPATAQPGSASQAPAQTAQPSQQTTIPASQGAERPANGEPRTETAESAEQAQAEKPKSRAQARIEKLARENRELMQRVNRLESGTQRKIEIPPPPKPMDFETDAEYHQAVAERAAALAIQKSQEGHHKSQLEETQQAQQAIIQELWETRSAEFAAKIPDFEAVAYSEKVPYSEFTLQIVRGLDNGPQVAYHLGKNPTQAARLAQMNPLEAAIEMGRISERVSRPVQRLVPKAPNPPPTVTGGGGIPHTKSLESMSMAEYAAHRKAGKS